MRQLWVLPNDQETGYLNSNAFPATGRALALKEELVRSILSKFILEDKAGTVVEESIYYQPAS